MPSWKPVCFHVSVLVWLRKALHRHMHLKTQSPFTVLLRAAYVTVLIENYFTRGRTWNFLSFPIFRLVSFVTCGWDGINLWASYSCCPAYTCFQTFLLWSFLTLLEEVSPNKLSQKLLLCTVFHHINRNISNKYRGWFSLPLQTEPFLVSFCTTCYFLL